MVSSVINLEVRLLYAFPAHVKQWCPASHCSLLSHFLKRERPVCPQEIFAASVKTSSLAYAARGARRKSEPCQDTVPHFLNHSLQQASGYRKTRMAAGWVAPLVTYHLYWSSGTLHELQGQQLAIPFVKCSLFWHTFLLEIPSRALNPILTCEVHGEWVLVGPLCDMTQTFYPYAPFSVYSLKTKCCCSSAELLLHKTELVEHSSGERSCISRAPTSKW